MTSVPANPADASAVKYSTAEIDSSCRGPVLLLFISSALWLVLGSVLALLASIKLHSPTMLAECPWLTYGRLQAAQTDIFLYGFASEAALGIALWLICRLGAVPLARPFAAGLGAAFWNIALAIGVLGVLAGDSTGFDWFEMPRYASPLFVFAFILIGVVAMFTYQARVERTTYVSQWFLMAALFMLPWTLTTANLLLSIFPVRGVMQAVVDYWFVGNFLYLWLASVAIAAVFYLAPKLTAQPVHSYYLALFGFWAFIFLGGWCGIPLGAPLPAWMPALSASARLLILIPIIAIVVNWRWTLSKSKVVAGPVLSFVKFASLAFLAAGILNAFGSLPSVARVAEFTIFNGAVAELWLYGFVAMAFFAAIYYIVPRLTLLEWGNASLISGHFWLAVIGVVIFVAALAVGGFKQGSAMNAGADSIALAKTTMSFLRPSTLGLLLIALANLLLLVNLLGIVRRRCCACCKCGDKEGAR